MSFSENPYRAPRAPEVAVQAEVVDVDRLWRKGRLLVMEKTATLPARCVKSNVPTNRRLKRSLSWHDPLIFLAILAGVLIYVILALVLRKTATIEIGLSDAWFAKRRRAIVIGWTAVLVSIALVIGGVAMGGRGDASVGLIVSGLLLFLAGAIYGLLAARMVAPTRISDTHVWLQGVCPAFLEGLPDWPHSP